MRTCAIVRNQPHKSSSETPWRARQHPRKERTSMRSRLPSATQFPFRRDNRRRDGLWDAPDATEDNVKGSSIDPYEPVWPRWKQAPPHHGEGEFVSDEPFFDIDEIAQRAEFYPPGTPLSTGTSTAIPHHAKEFVTFPAATSGEGACWSRTKTKRLSSSGRYRLRHMQHRIRSRRQCRTHNRHNPMQCNRSSRWISPEG